MKLNDLIKKLVSLQDNYGNLDVCVLVKSKDSPSGFRGALLHTTEMADIGGWGNETIYLSPYEELVSISEWKIKK